MDVLDYSLYSNYLSQITPPQIVGQGLSKTRKIKVDGQTIDICLSNISLQGNIYFFYEMTEAGKRQQIWNDEFFAEQKYFNVYNTQSTHKKAIQDIREIINGPLLWDLEEILLIDPYLMPNDILETVVYCKKQKVKIKCLTDLHGIINNNNTRSLVRNNNNKSNTKNGFFRQWISNVLFLFQQIRKNKDKNTRFSEGKMQLGREMKISIPSDTDMQLEYRTVHGAHGMNFHDRYLILKFNLNKARAW